MSLLQSPPRSSSAGLDLGPREGGDPSEVFGAHDRFGDDAAPPVDLGLELDLSTERPSAPARAKRGPGVLVAAIVASSLALGGIIMLVRDGGSEEVDAREPSAPPMTRAATVLVEPPAIAPAEPAPAKPVAPSRVASHQSPSQPSHPGPSARAPEITPAAIAPTSPARAGALPSEAVPTGEPAPSGLAPGLDLPAPVFDEPEPTAPVPSPASEPTPAPSDGGSAPLPGVEDDAFFEPEPEPDRAAS